MSTHDADRHRTVQDLGVVYRWTQTAESRLPKRHPFLMARVDTPVACGTLPGDNGMHCNATGSFFSIV